MNRWIPSGKKAQHLHPQTSQTLRAFENSQCNDAANWLENYIWSGVSSLLCRGRVEGVKSACMWSVGEYMRVYEDSLYEHECDHGAVDSMGILVHV